MSNPRGAKKSRFHTVEPSHEIANLSRWWIDLAISLAIFFFAFGARLTYLFQIEAIPLFYHLAGDARSYDQWAQQIAAGDWLGQEIFYQAPLYPYFLALLQFTFGHNLWWIRFVQIILGAVSCSLLYLVAKSFLSRGAGIAAGLILALYAPAIFFDGLIQKAALDLFLIVLMLVLLSSCLKRPSWIQWVVTGFVLGLLGLSRENSLVWLFVVPAWIWFYFSNNPPRRRVAWSCLFLSGLILALIPVGVRNLKVGGEFTLTTSQLGPNFFIGNSPEADGTYVPLRRERGDAEYERQDATELAEQALGRSLTPKEISSYWLRRSWDYIRSQPGDWLRLMWKKWLILWSYQEIEDADDFYLYQEWSWLLRALGWVNHFGVLAPLAAMGFVLTWRQRRRLWLLYALLATLALSVALFYVFGRYRFPMVPLLAMFAGAGLVEAFQLLKKHSLRWLLVGVVAVLLSLTVVHRPVAGRPVPSTMGYNNLGNALAKQGRFAEARESYLKALQVDPVNEVAHYNLGSLIGSQGKLEEARHHLQEAVRIHPGFAEAHSSLANVLTLQGELKEATRHFRKALELFPNQSEIQFKLGTVLAMQGSLEEAIDHFRKAVSIQPEFAAAHESLGRALAQQGKRDEALKHYEEALRIMKSRPATSASP